MFGKNTKNLLLVKDKQIIKKNFENVYEYKFEKNTNLIPKKTNKLLCIVFSEDRGAFFIWRKFENKPNIVDSFRFHKGLYIIDNESIHLSKNGIRIAFYLEGISTPIKMSNIEKEIVEIDYVDLDGSIKTAIVNKIKGLKFDAKILDIATDRLLAENFTKISEKIKYALITLIIVCVNVIVSGIVGYLVYHFR